MSKNNNKLIGYISDEYHNPIPGVYFEFINSKNESVSAISGASGSIYTDLKNDEYVVVINKENYGSKKIKYIYKEQISSFRVISHNLYGYMWPKWGISGEYSEYHLHCHDECQISLWKYGFEKKFISLINWHGEHHPKANLQILPDSDFTQSGVNWNSYGYRSSDHSQSIQCPETSGLYYIHMKSKKGDFFSFPWVIAPSHQKNKIAVLASTNTWNAYNNFGGRSNYINPDKLPLIPDNNLRSENDRYKTGGIDFMFRFEDDEYMPLSFQRPEPFNHIPEQEKSTDFIRGRNESHVAPAEWRLLAWLEREGFEYDLYSDYQLHSGILPLKDYKILILNTHPEYWSVEMYRKVKDWVFKNNGNLVYLGGDGIDGPITFHNDGERMTCLNKWENILMSGMEGHGKKGSYELRFHRVEESPANLLGVCPAAGIMKSAPYKVLEEGHWVFEGTGLSKGQLFGTNSLQERCSGGAAGHETDCMTKFSPANTLLLAKGVTTKSGAEMVIIENNNSGNIFSVGSVAYTSSLLVDENISVVTKNVLNRFKK